MNNEIDSMLRALKPALKNFGRAKAILTAHWRNKGAIIWTIDHVHRAANERHLALTNEEARELLAQFIRLHNRQHGLQWRDLLELIDESVLGREMNRHEVSRFVEHDVITVAKRQPR